MIRPSAPLGVVPLDAGHHAVAVQRLLHVDRGDVDVAPRRGAAFSGTTNPKPAGVAGEPPDHEVHAGGQADARAADLDHLAVGDQRAQHGLQLAPPLGVEPEPRTHLPHTPTGFPRLREHATTTRSASGPPKVSHMRHRERRETAEGVAGRLNAQAQRRDARNWHAISALLQTVSFVLL